ncbi:Deoxynucleotidyltransferase Terminal-Interacting Protein 1 [Manis pentadactyla]|nr:Deoxynucleotidyltransferase Terminal-Interacting Protein 1 [Manis pentadactyla]
MEATGDVEQPRGPSGAERGGLELGDAGAAVQLVLRNPWNIMIKHRQPSISEEIQTVFNKYMKFFQKATLTVRENVGEDVDAEQLTQEACRSCLEQAKLLFPDGEKVMPRSIHELPGIKHARQAEEECAHHESPIPKKRKGRTLGHMISNDWAAASMVRKPKSLNQMAEKAPSGTQIG